MFAPGDLSVKLLALVTGIRTPPSTDKRVASVSPRTRIIALAVSAAMFAFSSWMYVQTGDWVAAVFALGSLGYGLFFAGFARSDKS